LRKAYTISVGKSELNRSLGRPRRRKLENIKIDLKQIVREGVEGIKIGQDRD
jgi:hypothetical protein